MREKKQRHKEMLRNNKKSENFSIIKNNKNKKIGT